MNRCKLPTLMLFSIFFIACEKDGPQLQIAKEPPIKYEKAVNLQGTVSDNNGLIKEGKIEARTLDGQLIAETKLENTAKYRIEIPADSVWPLILGFSADQTSHGKETMVSIAIQPTNTRYDINPSTTGIARQAKSMGGYTLRNLTRAAEDRVNVPDANKTSTGFRGDPTTQYGGWH